MYKRTLTLFLFVFLLFFSRTAFGQSYSINIQIFEPLPTIDFGSLIIQNNLQGAPKVFYVEINPPGKMVKIQGVILWDKKDGVGYRQFVTFTTNTFLSQSFYSDALGTNSITIASSTANAGLASDLIVLGKPTGAFKFQLNLLDPNGTLLATTNKEIQFTNPSQTLSILSPTPGSIQPIGAVIARWTRINGAQKYRIKLNVRTNSSQSFEDALNSGTPLIDDRDVDGGGDVTNIELRNYLSREWNAGQELVLQVKAVIAGVSGGTVLNSEIVNFQIARANDEPIDNTKNELITFLMQLQNENAAQLAVDVSHVSMDNVRFFDNDGGEITFFQFRNIVSAIRNSIVRITLINQ